MINDKQYPIALLLATLLFVGCEEHLVAPEDSAHADQRAVSANDRFLSGSGEAPALSESSDPTASKRGDRAVTTPFKANFFTDLGGMVPDEERCGDPMESIFLNIQSGEGRAAHLGRLSVEITFCVDATDFLDDGALTGNDIVPYWDGRGTFTAANGDLLDITIAGAILPSDHPDFDFEFADPFEIVGGTGRFRGASGSGRTNSFVDSSADPPRTTHEWLGTLSFVPGA